MGQQVVTGCKCEELKGGCDDMVETAKNGFLTSSASEVPHPSLVNHQLLCAARDGDAMMLQVAIHSGAFLETRRPLAVMTSDQATNKPVKGRKEGLTPLMYASQGGYVKCLNSLLQAKAQVNALDEDGVSPLHFASTAASLECAKALLKHRADVTHTDHCGKSFMDFLPDEVTLHPASYRKWKELLSEAQAQAGGDEIIEESTTASSQTASAGPSSRQAPLLSDGITAGADNRAPDAL